MSSPVFLNISSDLLILQPQIRCFDDIFLNANTCGSSGQNAARTVVQRYTLRGCGGLAAVSSRRD
jgi:hypothetical protein